ncbi:MAG: DUF3120 domain-containing protein [Oculatellaceae cyanobacterium bins.114]|nr:DUF3120 domain-containing protein [Oculatellaceae cyanobacterium bins.114]
MSLTVPQTRLRKTWWVLAAAVFLVSVPVFIQAPLVREFPWLSLGLTIGFVGLSLWLRSRSTSFVWGDLLLGFSWTWLAGSIYWGWLRWEPFWHLPIEAIGLPFVVFALAKGWGKIGGWFYLGSLFGTALTDIYFYLVDLIPYWRKLMQVPLEEAQPVFQGAIAQIQTPWGIATAIALVTILLVVGYLPLRSSQLHWWAFGGAVLSTIFVDGLFWFAATIA